MWYIGPTLVVNFYGIFRCMEFFWKSFGHHFVDRLGLRSFSAVFLVSSLPMKIGAWLR